jgi:seryl-tRNA synthetase
VIDLKLLRSAPEQVRAALARRGDPALKRLLDEIEALEAKRRALTAQLDQLKAERNDAARADAQLVKQHGKLPPEVVEQRRKLGERIAELEQRVRDAEAEVTARALFVPNLPLADVPDGGEGAAVVVRTWGEPRPKGDGGALRPHWDLAERLGILDLPRGAKLSGSGFPLFVGAGAHLVRALVNFMLDLHTREHGYVEVEPPFVVRREIMQGTGQVPKFEDDAYKTTPDDLFLVPTAEVPVTNLHRDEILDGSRLPLAYTAYTPCFRREAGAHGKDTRGLLRVHQFDKVELVRFCRPQDSPAEHEQLTAHAEAVLRRLELPYRVVLLPAGDFGFASAKTYDLEVWAPGVGQWLEVSSSSTFTDFQARRAGIRYRARSGERLEFVHTLNASGVALPRTIAALLEHGQQPDGSVRLPAALVPYFGADRIEPPGAAAAAAADGA